jgi:meiotically up-regulated gene 157 (Mug157) protein
VEFLRHTSHDGFVHESVNVNQTQAMTRVWFAWANSYFGELMIYLVERYPHLVK